MKLTEEKVILITPKDEVLGVMNKLEAHQKGILHRAFSIFLFDKKGNILLQRRAKNKYHSPNQWTNACCSHPRENETYLQAAKRRLQEELGISCELEKKFDFIYKADVGSELWEHELDYVFTGIYEGNFRLNPEEVSEIKYISLHDLEQEIHEFPENFTEWFKIILKEYKQHL